MSPLSSQHNATLKTKATESYKIMLTSNLTAVSAVVHYQALSHPRRRAGAPRRVRGAFAARFVMLPAAGYQTGASKKHRL